MTHRPPFPNQPGSCAHCGPGNFRLRLHLGLRVPPGEGCRIRCADQRRTWQEGKVPCSVHVFTTCIHILIYTWRHMRMRTHTVICA